VAYTPEQIVPLLAKARMQARRRLVTLHIVERAGWFSTKLEIVESLRPNDVVVLRDIQPIRLTDEMVKASRLALDHNPQRAADFMDTLRAITHRTDGTAFETEELAVLIWKLAEELNAADLRRTNAVEA
jgi:hypothetical protein